MATTPPTPPEPEDPHVGSADDPRREVDTRDEHPVVPPRRYAGEDADRSVERARPAPTLLDRLESASGPLSLIVFFLIGFGTGKWYIAWIVFLLPAVLHAWNRPSTKR